jgi:hypothetical protein
MASQANSVTKSVKQAFFPTVLIGLGDTGTEAVVSYKEQLIAALGHIPDSIAFIAINIHGKKQETAIQHITLTSRSETARSRQGDGRTSRREVEGYPQYGQLKFLSPWKSERDQVGYIVKCAIEKIAALCKVEQTIHVLVVGMLNIGAGMEILFDTITYVKSLSREFKREIKVYGVFPALENDGLLRQFVLPLQATKTALRKKEASVCKRITRALGLSRSRAKDKFESSRLYSNPQRAVSNEIFPPPAPPMPAQPVPTPPIKPKPQPKRAMSAVPQKQKIAGDPSLEDIRTWKKHYLFQKLLARVRRDEGLAIRLINYEKKRRPNASVKTLIETAIWRLDRDNR